MGSLVTRTVNRVSSEPAKALTTYAGQDFAYDYAINGTPFLSAASQQFPLSRKTAPYRKDQVDPTPIPGEQSMVFWWLRSQISFHGGAGIKFEEPALDPATLYSDPLSAAAIPFRYQDSEGVDTLSVPGQVTLLPATVQEKSATSPVLLMGTRDGNGVDCWFQAENNQLYRCVEGSHTTITWGGLGPILSMTNDGFNYFVADATGVYKGPLDGSANGSKLWDAGTDSGSVVVGWVKDRLIVCVGPAVYEILGTAANLDVTNVYTPNSGGWYWTSIEEGPDSIFLAGTAGNVSRIYSIGLTTDASGTPILGSPVEVAVMPRGETIYALRECLGSYLAIGTSVGLRIADIGNGGSLQWGPMLFTTTSPIQDITSFDRFIYAAASNAMSDGTSGLIRVDLGFQTELQRFSYSKDLRTHTNGAVHSVVQFGGSGRLVIGVDNKGSYLAQPKNGNLETSGYLQTGNIRFHTQEDKLYKFVGIQAAPLQHGAINVEVTDSDGGYQSILTYGAGTPLDKDSQFPQDGPKEWVSLTFTLTRDPASTKQGPTFYSYQVRALPAQPNQRYIMLPLHVFDKETDKNGVRVGYEGHAWERLSALEATEQARDVVQFQDFTRNGQTSVPVVIDDITFEQIDPPAGMDGIGGRAMVTLRTVN